MDTLGQARLGAEDAQASSGTSGRKGSKKVRSGCITCKIRKVKCDETKPYCLRCTKTGRKCDGYLDDAALAIRRQRRRRPEPGLFDDSAVGSQGQLANALPTHAATTTAASTPEISSAVKSSSAATFKSRLLDRQPWETAQEKRAFDFFRHTTAPCLAGDLDAVFWRVLVLQICHTEPAVWHAVLAVSSLHEVLLQSSSEPCMPLQDTSGAPSPSAPSPSCAARIVLQTEFALRHYNKAIAYLLDDMKLESTDMSGCGFDATAKSAPRRPVTLLMTCVLFVCLEMMQGKDKEALVHLQQGRLLLKQLGSCRAALATSNSSVGWTPALSPTQQESAHGDTSPDMAVIRQHFVPLYTRLSLTSFLLGGDPEPIPAHLKTTSPDRLPDTFDSIHALRAAVHDFLDAALRFTRRARPVKYPAERRRRMSSASASSSFASYRSSSLSSSPSSSPLSPSSPVSFQSMPASSAPDDDDDSKARADIPQPRLPDPSLCNLEAEKQALLAQLSQLRVALSLFRIDQTSVVAALANPSEAAMLVLQVHLCLAEIWLTTAFARTETAYDTHVETFSTVVSLAATILDTERQQQQRHLQQQQKQQHSQQYARVPPGMQSSVFTLETHVLPALYCVATKCRHGRVRQAALSLLTQNSTRRENLWRADVLRAIAERIVKVEEGAANVDAADKKVSFHDAFKGEASRSADVDQWEFMQQKSPRAFTMPWSVPANKRSGPGTSSMSSTAADEGDDDWGGGGDFPVDRLYSPQKEPVLLRTLVPKPSPSSSARLVPDARVKKGSASTTLFSITESKLPRPTPMPRPAPNRAREKSVSDIPEYVRVHAAVIGPEEDEGRWVTLFRKLDGPDDAWNIQNEFVS